MKAMKWRVGSFVVAAGIIAASLVTGAAPKNASADPPECVPVCLKHPITGELQCTPPCP